MKRHQLLLTASALTVLLLSACGSGRDLADGLDLVPDTAPPSASSGANDALAAAIPKILAGLEDIKQEIKALEIRGSSGTRSSRRNSPYTSMSYSPSTLPRYIFRFPTMWTTTNPMPMMPVIAMTYFLPTAVEYTSRRNGLRLRGF